MGDPYTHTCDQYWLYVMDFIGYVYFIIALFDYKVQFALSFDNVCAYCTTRTKWVSPPIPGRLPSPEHDNYWDAMQIILL